MNERQILQFFNRAGVIIGNSHFVYTSGKHGASYINKDAIYPHTRETSALCREIAKKFADYGVQVVVAPAIGGVILSQWIAFHLSKITGQEILGVYAEKTDDGKFFIIKRGYDKLVAGKNVLVAEDVLTTGSSVKKVVEAIRAVGGNIVGLGALCNRGNVTRQDVANVPELIALINIKLDVWEEAECPLCVQGVPFNSDVGKGKEYLWRQVQEKIKRRK